MCGIAGFLSPNLTKNHLDEMTYALRHRGPNADGTYYNSTDGIGFGHRRLSVLDPTESANQPFMSHCGRYIMIYNGEVYNFQKIKDRLPNRSWKTRGDTEVILEAYVEWGKNAILELNGMFAGAIYDTSERSIFLFRDRIGIKPLYYYQDSGELVFASELKALVNVLKKKLTISNQAVYDFLHLGYIPDEGSIYSEIKKLRAGHAGLFKNGEFKIDELWKLHSQLASETICNEPTAKALLHETLRDAVEFRLVSDVPLGTFLSGGIDSSIVTAIAQDLTDRSIKTFSIGFEEQTHDESRFAEKVAKHLDTDHHSFLLSENEALDKVERSMKLFDQPFGDSSAIPTLLVSEMARKHVTVALSGDGGDEQFMGYGAYRWARRLHNPLVNITKPLIQAALNLGDLRMQRAALLFDYTSKYNIQSHIFSQEQYLFSEKELVDLLKPVDGYRINTSIGTEDVKIRTLSVSEKQALFDLNYYLRDDLLVKVDMASMYHSLEVRVPLLDHRIVSFSLNLDETLKYKGKTTKYLLRKILYDYVPKPLFDRPKWGFSVPLGKWLTGELRYLIDDYLNEELIEAASIVDFSRVEKLKEEFFKGKTFYYNKIWVLVLLHKWWKENYQEISLPAYDST